MSSSPSSQVWRTGSQIQPSATLSGGLKILGAEQGGKERIRQQIIDLYDELKTPLHAYLACLGMSLEQAEDIIQEAFLRLVSCSFSRRKEDNLRGWVFRVAHNLSMDVHRFQRRWSLSTDDEAKPLEKQPTDPRPTPEQRIIAQERSKSFDDAFAQLTPKQRQCVLLRAEGFRYREIAEVLGVSVQRVGEIMQRSIALLEVHFQ